MEELRSLIETMAKALVDSPEEVKVEVVGGSHTIVYELKVAKSDLGKIIGKHGQNAASFRTILIGASTKLKVRTVLEILE